MNSIGLTCSYTQTRIPRLVVSNKCNELRAAIVVAFASHIQCHWNDDKLDYITNSKHLTGTFLEMLIHKHTHLKCRAFILIFIIHQQTINPSISKSVAQSNAVCINVFIVWIQIELNEFNEIWIYRWNDKSHTFLLFSYIASCTCPLLSCHKMDFI